MRNFFPCKYAKLAGIGVCMGSTMWSKEKENRHVYLFKRGRMQIQKSTRGFHSKKKTTNYKNKMLSRN